MREDADEAGGGGGERRYGKGRHRTTGGSGLTDGAAGAGVEARAGDG